MFESTRLKLTAWYLLIIMFVSIAFSLVIYGFLSREIERIAYNQKLRVERNLRDSEMLRRSLGYHNPTPTVFFVDDSLVDEVKRRIVISLAIVNLVILLLSGGFGYLLAGKTLRPIQEMVEEQNRFISDASHELRTPLTSLRTGLEVSLRDKKLPLHQAKQTLTESLNEVKRLQYLAENLLQLAEYQRAGTPTHLAPLELQHIVHQAVQQLQPLARAKKLVINTHLQPAIVKGDHDQLLQLVVILLDNAIKYSHHDQSIDVSLVTSRKTILLAVTDHGIGISKTDLANIFDRFYRADTARTHQAQNGYGLGLAIAQRIIATHHGEISVKSTLAKGTSFTVSFAKA